MIHHTIESYNAEKATNLWVLGSRGLPDFIAKRCSSERRCASYADNRHPNTFSGKKQLPLHEKYRVPAELIHEILSQAQQQADIAKHAEEAGISKLKESKNRGDRELL